MLWYCHQFAEVKRSGYGKESGPLGMDEVVNKRLLTLNDGTPAHMDYPRVGRQQPAADPPVGFARPPLGLLRGLQEPALTNSPRRLTVSISLERTTRVRDLSRLHPGELVHVHLPGTLLHREGEVETVVPQHGAL